jgi:hypothetical protein
MAFTLFNVSVLNSLAVILTDSFRYFVIAFLSYSVFNSACVVRRRPNPIQSLLSVLDFVEFESIELAVGSLREPFLPSTSFLFFHGFHWNFCMDACFDSMTLR